MQRRSIWLVYWKRLTCSKFLAHTLHSFPCATLPTPFPPTLSSSLPLQDMVGNKETPVMQGHGDRDTTVHYLAGSKTAEMIKSFNPHNHKFYTYKGMDHSSCPKVGGVTRVTLHACNDVFFPL